MVGALENPLPSCLPWALGRPAAHLISPSLWLLLRAPPRTRVAHLAPRPARAGCRPTWAGGCQTRRVQHASSSALHGVSTLGFCPGAFPYRWQLPVMLLLELGASRPRVEAGRTCRASAEQSPRSVYQPRSLACPRLACTALPRRCAILACRAAALALPALQLSGLMLWPRCVVHPSPRTAPPLHDLVCCARL